ncbi:MAG: PHB depolymerase family esterase [Vicinamibacterales bacterium]
MTAGLLTFILGVARIAAAEIQTWQVDGDARQAIVFAPETARTTPAPLVLSFHGFGDGMENFQHTGLHRAWPEAIVVYFQGLPTRGGWPGWQVERGQYGDRDLKLVDAAVAALRAQFRVDDRRIYATGFSNGGGFTYLLWAERPRLFAAFAPVAGRLAASVAPSVPKPLMHVAGRRDAVVRFSDQQAAFETAARVNGGVEDRRPCGEGCTEYRARPATPVVVWIHEGAHTYPGETSDRIAGFFRQHAAR